MARYVADLHDLLNERSLIERKSFVRSSVKEVKVTGNAIVIGENMNRVEAAASKLGAAIFKGKGMEANKAWIQAAKESGAKIYDIGPDMGRRLSRFVRGETPFSPFYNMERKSLVGYTMIKLWGRTGKFWGNFLH